MARRKYSLAKRPLASMVWREHPSYWIVITNRWEISKWLEPNKVSGTINCNVKKKKKQATSFVISVTPAWLAPQEEVLDGFTGDQTPLLINSDSHRQRRSVHLERRGQPAVNVAAAERASRTPHLGLDPPPASRPWAASALRPTASLRLCFAASYW